MANPIPCQVCGTIQDAEFLVTDRTDGFQLLGVPTQGMCVGCFIGKAGELAAALQAAYEEYQANPEPGVLESIEQDEGPMVEAEPAPPKGSKSRSKPDAPAEVAVPLPEAETADVDR